MFALKFKPGGLGQYVGPWGCIEVHVSTCSHCQHQTEFESMRKMHEHVDVCRNCMRLVCLRCAGGPCVTYAKQADIEEAEYRRKFYGNLREF